MLRQNKRLNVNGLLFKRIKKSLNYLVLTNYLASDGCLEQEDMVALLMDLSSGINEKNWSDDRILTLKIVDDKAPLNSTGLVDKRLFSGENKLHAIADKQTGLWFFRYE